MDLPRLANRDPKSHKGTYGRALLVGGSRGMTGAISLAGSATVRAGAGLVTLAVPDRCLETVARYEPNYMTVALADDEQGRIAAAAIPKLIQLSQNATSIGIGPGLSQNSDITNIVTELYKCYKGPMVVDADALNALAKTPNALSTHAGPRILTPHVGEFRRLAGEPDLTPDECRERVAGFANDRDVIVVMKGHRSLVTDGKVTFENTTGNPGMATGGSGDVLTGVITALLGQQNSPFTATAIGVHAHGLAGDLARESHGEIGMTAESIRDHLGAAFQQLTD